MLVAERMTRTPITIPPDMSVPDALRLMRDKKIRRLPVLDAQGKLVGIVSDKDLLLVAPSPATTLAIWEITDLLSKLKVEKVMTRDVITVTEDTPIEEAARIMADRKIGGLPVMRAGQLVGIITETDLFKAFLQMLGGRRPGVRLTLAVAGAKGTLARISSAIFNVGGDIVGLGLIEAPDSAGTEWHVAIKVQDAAREKLVEAVRPLVKDILDVREM
jgi:acetoin utilization protein AcuB